MGSHETGHRNYQSPQRNESHFGPYLDNFSAWAIYISLLALSFDSNLWTKAKAGDENLLFRRTDFEAPYSSQVMNLLSQHSDSRIQTLFELFQSIFYLQPQQVPSLNPPPHLLNGAGDPSAQTIPTPASANGSSQTAGNDMGGWVKDHLPPAQSQTAAANPSQSPSQGASATDAGNATWVLDFISNPQPPKPFTSSLTIPRALFYMGVVLVLWMLQASLLAPIFVAESFIAALITAGGFIISLIWYYRRDIEVETRYQLLAQLKADAQGVALWNQSIQQHENKKSALKAEESKALSLWAKQRASLQQQENRETALIQGELLKKIKEFDARIQTLEKPLEQLRKTTSQNINLWTQEINQIAQKQTSDLNSALQTLQKNHYDNYLRQATISGASIHGIGPQMKANLLAAGFHSAADINWGVTNAYGIGDAKASQLMAWRKGIEQRANSTKPASLPQSQREAIVQQFEAQRNRLQQQIQAAAQHLKQEETAIKKQTATAQQIIASERKTAEAEVQKRIQDVKTGYANKLQEITRQEQKIKNECNQNCKVVDEEITAIRKSMQEHSWNTAKLNRDFEPYRHLTFKAYLLMVSINRGIK